MLTNYSISHQMDKDPLANNLMSKIRACAIGACCVGLNW